MLLRRLVGNDTQHAALRCATEHNAGHVPEQVTQTVVTRNDATPAFHPTAAACDKEVVKPTVSRPPGENASPELPLPVIQEDQGVIEGLGPLLTVQRGLLSRLA